MRLRHPALAAALALASVLLSGCMETDEVASPEEPKSKTMTVATDFGEITIPAEPKKALGMYTTDVDMLIALGYNLADEQPIRGDGGYTGFPSFFPQDELEDVTPFANYPDYNYEKILAVQPDFILNGLGYDKKTVKRLPEIAPTYSVDAFDGRNWMEHFEETAKALGRTEQYEAWVAKYEKRLAEVKEAIGDQSGTTVAPFSYYEGKVSSACYTGVECKAFEDLGLTIYPGAEKKGGEGVTLSAEQLGQLSDVDYAFAIKAPGEKGDQEFDQVISDLSKNKLFNDLGFVKDDQIVTYDMEMTFGSPSGQMAFLDVVEEALAP